jgi:hypothetical protein
VSCSPSNAVGGWQWVAYLVNICEQPTVGVENQCCSGQFDGMRWGLESCNYQCANDLAPAQTLQFKCCSQEQKTLHYISHWLVLNLPVRTECFTDYRLSDNRSREPTANSIHSLK